MPVDPENVDFDSDWHNLSGKIGGRRAYLRRNSGIARLQDLPNWSHEVRVAIHFNRVRQDGMPDGREELSALDVIEDTYRNELQHDRRSVLALTITSDGIRDLIFYTTDPEGVIRKFEERLKPTTTNRRVELFIRPDSAWELYRQFA